MSDVPVSFTAIQQESVQFNNPVSEASLSALGASINGLLASDLIIAAGYSTLSSTTITAGVAIRYTTLVYDTDLAYNTSTGVYTAPKAGFYRFTTCGPFLGAGFTDYSAQVNGVTIYATYGTLSSLGRNTNSFTVELNEDDAATIIPSASVTAANTNSFLFIERVTGYSVS